MVEVTIDDAADAEKEAVSEPQPQSSLIGGEDDDDDDAPLDRQLARVRQITGDSISSTVTSDTETQGEEERHSRPKGPKVDTTNLPKDTERAVDSPIVDSPAVGVSSMCLPPCGFRALYSRRAILQSPSTTMSAADRRRQKKARQRAKGNNKPAKGT